MCDIKVSNLRYLKKYFWSTKKKKKTPQIFTITQTQSQKLKLTERSLK